MKIGNLCFTNKEIRQATALLRRDNLAVLKKRSELALASVYDFPKIERSAVLSKSLQKKSDKSVRNRSVKHGILVLAATLVLIFAMTMIVSASVRQMTLDFIRKVVLNEDRVVLYMRIL